MLKYSLIECIDPITNEVMYFECLTPVTPDEMENVSSEVLDEVFLCLSSWGKWTMKGERWKDDGQQTTDNRQQTTDNGQQTTDNSQ